MKKVMICVMYCFFMLPNILFSVAVDPVPCVQELQRSFFQRDYLTQAFSIYNIPQGIWVPLINDLQYATERIPRMMQARTANMVRNPLSYPMQRRETFQLLKDVWYDVYMDVMSKYQLTEQPNANLIFSYLLLKQRAKIEACFGPE